VLKAAGTAARLELEALLGTRVHLETRVKVDPTGSDEQVRSTASACSRTFRFPCDLARACPRAVGVPELVSRIGRCRVRPISCRGLPRERLMLDRTHRFRRAGTTAPSQSPS